ncbi:hypothetical protein ABMA27_005591 [Loxostege sticticalis]|uniref:FP protein C-terminal domain-containing protein n=1 Tax=Loxostege sticticalis TaxID=481309 RepID=A0ABR3HJQ1_LOXSC
MRAVKRCRLCIGKFHYQCINIDRQQFLAITKEQASTWICPACSNVTRRARSNDNTPVRQGNLTPRLEDCLDMSCELSDPSTSNLPPAPSSASRICSVNNTTAKEEVTMDRISALLDEKLSASLSIFMENFRKVIRSDVREMVKSEIGSALKGIRDEFSETTDFICAEQKTLRLNARLASIDKISRNCNIELQAIPERKSENVLELLKKLCEVVKVPVEDVHISACRRVAKLNTTSNRPRNILVSFSTPRIRDLVLSATHRYNKKHSGCGLRSSDLDIPGEPCRIFVTEHLSPEQKQLHAATRIAAKEHKYKYVWVKYGQIYVRKDDSAGAILVRNRDCLDKIC